MSEVASGLLVFTASIAVTTAAIGYLATAVQDLARSGEQVGQEAARQLRTDVQLINDPAAVPAEPRFYVKNTGAEALDPNATTLLVDGAVRSAAGFVVLNGSSPGRWMPGEVLEAHDAGLVLGPGDHTVTVVVERGVRDSLRVRV